MSYPVFEFVEPKPRALKRKVLMAALILIAVAGAVLAGLQIAHKSASKPVTALINKIQPNTEWSPNGEVIANGKFCTGYPVPCDSISRSYHSNSAVTSADIRDIVAGSGFNLAVADTCDSSPRPSVGEGSSKECFATGVVDGYDVTIRATQDSESSPASDINFSVSSVSSRWR